MNELSREQAVVNLAKAIHDHAVAFQVVNPEVEILSEFGVIAHWQKIVVNDRTRYTTHFSIQGLPNHICIGLFEMGKQLSIGDVVD